MERSNRFVETDSSFFRFEKKQPQPEQPQPEQPSEPKPKPKNPRNTGKV